jgi:hypothetical protein
MQVKSSHNCISDTWGMHKGDIVLRENPKAILSMWVMMIYNLMDTGA